MRVVLIGRQADRDRLRGELVDREIEIVAETATVAAAREAGVNADALVVASAAGGTRDDEGRLADEPLTPRELDVLNLIALGLPNKGIAGRLGISDQTVKFHVAAIIGKLGAANRTEAVRLAVRRALIDL